MSSRSRFVQIKLPPSATDASVHPILRGYGHVEV